MPHLTEGPVFEYEGEVGGGPVEVWCAGAPLQHLLIGRLKQAVAYVVPGDRWLEVVGDR